MLTEALLLALAGCLLGVGLAALVIRVAVASLPSMLSSLGLTASVNGRVLLWSAALALLSGLVVGLGPALQASRTDPHALLRDARASASRGTRRLRQGLVLAEVALSVVLLAGAGLLLRSYGRIMQVDPGFDTRNLLTMRITLPREKYEGVAIHTFFKSVIERTAAIPGVRAASVASQFPPMGTFDLQFSLEGSEASGTTLPKANITIVSPSHFETLGVPITAGRAFGPSDRASAPRVAIVNRAFAERFLAGRSPIGRRLLLGDAGDAERPSAEIVGVVANTRNRGLTSPVEPEIFVGVEQQTLWNQLFLLVRGDVPAETLLSAVRREIAAIDPEQPVYAIGTLEEAIGTTIFQQRLSAILLAVFAAIALTLAGLGIYGVMSYTVVARTQEIGVRMAIGAARRDVVRLVMGQVARLSIAGLALGLVAAAALAPMLRRVLFAVEPHDPGTLVAVAVTLGLVAALAGWLPARRASRVDPLIALRME
jgi:predicted permease